ncbi:social motility TPR repeat lipoprotein Tgl [Corallococcus exiguus]|uniref:social motility TPR repeat lipoprotein Tgl n=1 Tax=Corallococcus exiguus TaxID=83462 RepID=UPI001472B378|nr:social motility TPR repeat lipoprotein Tgl [Corallococcus exiguus]NNB95496.1 social motility TPR repeat lipoprotein Tgl [Corallococcus exiguus]
MFRITSSCFLAFALASAGCAHVPTEKERQGSEIHYDLGVQAQQHGHVQDALAEYQKALELNPGNPEAHNAVGLLLHLSFQRLDEASAHYEKALALRPSFSDARTNLGNLRLAQGRYDDAIKLYEASLNDMQYRYGFSAQGNLGWALYKKGDTANAVQNIKAAITTNPDFCLGYKNLGIIYDETGKTEEACRQFAHYREKCPEVAEAYQREGVCQAKLGRVEEAKKAFAGCEAKAQSNEQVLKDDCRSLLDHL